MKEHGLMPKMLEKSRFNRRFHAVAELMFDLFHQVGWALKMVNGTTEYLLDSFPVKLCENIRIPRARLVQSQEYRGYIASKRCYFYGVRVYLLTSKDGILVEFRFFARCRSCSAGPRGTAVQPARGL